MLCIAGNYVSEETTASIINVIVSTHELNVYSVHKLYLAVKNNLNQEGLVKIGVYVIGEFGDILVSNNVLGPDNENIVVTEEDVIKLLKDINGAKYSSSNVKEYLMNCYVKLTTKFSPKNVDEIKYYLEQETKSYFYEVQQRAVEYVIFNKILNSDIRKEVTKHIPPSKSIKENEVRKYISYIIF